MGERSRGKDPFLPQPPDEAACRRVVEPLLSALELLHRHPWPGNVRQLRNAAERAVVMADGEVLLPQHLPADILHPPEPPALNGGGPGPAEAPLVTLEEMEKRMIRRALREGRGREAREHGHGRRPERAAHLPRH